MSATDIRDRIIEFKRVPSGEIADNDRNWRTHPHAQRAALAEVLDQIGIAGAITAYYSKRNGGKLTLIDGHERRSHDAEWPTLILDVSDEEADKLLLTLDPITGLASTDGDALGRLLDGARFGTPALEDLLHTLRADASSLGDLSDDELAGIETEERFLPEMELQPFEHYDYVMLLCRSTHDWLALHDLLDLKQVEMTLPGGEKRVGFGRVIDASKVVKLLRAAAKKK